MSGRSWRSNGFRILLVAIAVVSVPACLVLAGGLDHLLWTQRVTIGGVSVHVPVVPALRFATTSLGGNLLDGQIVESRFGAISFHWNNERERLEMACTPCRLRVAAVSVDALEFDAIRITMQRNGDRLSGEVLAGELLFNWWGDFTGQGFALAGEVPDVPSVELFALFRSRIPELAVARIAGSFGMTVVWQLPSGSPQIELRLSLNHVEGLGTEVLRTGALGNRCEKAGPVWQDEKHDWRVFASSERARDGARMLRAAVIAAEDQNFYRHSGYDTEAMAAWFGINNSRGRVVGGASTISQQLARLLYAGGERTHIRKLRELLYAAEMERTIGKVRILELYLMHVPWGPGVCGASAAARYYFGKSVEELTVVEAAWMAGLLRNPKQADPANAVQADRTQWIVGQMVTIPRGRREAALRELSRTGKHSS